MDVLGIAILLVLVAGTIPSLYALVDAARRPADAWATVNRSKPAWMFALLVLGLPAAIGYLALVRPALELGRRRTPEPELRLSDVPRRKADWGDPWADA